MFVLNERLPEKSGSLFNLLYCYTFRVFECGSAADLSLALLMTTLDNLLII
jgi:hypothetical protein